LSEAVLFVSSFIAAAYLIRSFAFEPTLYLLYDNGILRTLIAVFSLVVVLYFQDLYSSLKVRSRVLLIYQFCMAMGVLLIVQALVNFMDPRLRLPLRILLVGSLLSMALAIPWRLFFSACALDALGRESLLLVGDSPLLDDIAAYVKEHPEKGLAIAGYVGDFNEKPEPVAGKVLGPIAALTEIAGAIRPTRIVVGMSDRRKRMPVQDLLELRLSGYIVEEASSTYEKVCCRVCLKELRPSQLIYSGELGPRSQDVLPHRLLDMFLAALGILLSSPLLLVTALAIRFSSPGPILYRQRRVGLKGVPFTLYKFRSMRTDAEAATGPVWASRDDPRVTPVGRIIRNTRIDELPQLFNVLKGEMSIIGPRPERPAFVKGLSEQIPFYRQRHFVRPGITGWAQINYKYGDTIEHTKIKLEYDLYYIKNMSVALDIVIVLQTAKTMLLSRGAR
jgi:sugar transferase (PEP-CTERM system associated)